MTITAVAFVLVPQHNTTLRAIKTSRMFIIPAVNTSAELDPTISVTKQIRTNPILI